MYCLTSLFLSFNFLRIIRYEEFLTVFKYPVHNFFAPKLHLFRNVQVAEMTIYMLLKVLSAKITDFVPFVKRKKVKILLIMLKELLYNNFVCLLHYSSCFLNFAH